MTLMNSPNDHDDLLACMKNIMFRTCSKIEDESLVFASISKCKTAAPSKLILVEPLERYRTLFTSLNSVPVGIVFLDQKRYEDYGSRWIPKSLLSQNSQLARPILKEDTESDGWPAGWPFRKTGEGLQIKAAGFDLLPRPLRVPPNFRVCLAGFEYLGFVHAAGYTQPLDGLTGEFAIITPSSIWKGAPVVQSALVRILERCYATRFRDTFQGLKTRHEALVELIRHEQDPSRSLDPVIKAEPNEFMKWRMKKMEGNFANWRIG
jgi:hypothetical protein